MFIVEWIIDRVWGMFWFFYDAYLETSGWWWPFKYLSIPFQGISNAIYAIIPSLYDFKNWVANMTAMTARILAEGDIWSILWLPITWAESAWTWVQNAWSNVWDEIEIWWKEEFPFVEGLIDTAKQVLRGEISIVDGLAKATSTAFDGFLGITLPTLATLTGVGGLIDSALKKWFPWYDALAQSIDGILTFFTDPAKAVYELFDYIIDRFWEDTA